MKTKSINFSKLFALCLTACTLLIGVTSCNNESSESASTAEPQDTLFCYESSITPNEYKDVTNQIYNAIKYSTRAPGEEMTEEEAIIVLQPLVKDGRQLQNQILLQQNELQLTPADVSEIENMTEDQLAEMSFTFQTIYNSAVTTQSVSGQDIVDCLLVAVGMDDLRSLEGYLNAYINYKYVPGIGDVISGTRALMTAKTARSIICAFARRTAGWIGVAYMIYQFSDCIASKQ